MIAFFSSKRDPTERVRQQIERHLRKSRYAAAYDLQWQVCQDDKRSIEEWTRLVEIAAAGGLEEKEITARLELARLTRPSPEVWLGLAQRARKQKLADAMVTAEFRAGEAFALVGDAERALERFEEVLALDPRHNLARRLRQLMSRKLERMSGSAPVKRDRTGEQEKGGLRAVASEEITLTFLRNAATKSPSPPMGLAYDDPNDLPTQDEVTSPDWSPPSPNVGTEAAPTAARYVLEPQLWPTVLSRRPLIFVGAGGGLEEMLEQSSEKVVVAEGSELLRQGYPSQILYHLGQGEIAVRRTWGEAYDLGTVSEGHFVAEMGALTGLPSTTTVTVTKEAVVDTVTHDRVVAQTSAHNGCPQIIRLLRTWYLDTVFQICPLSRHDSDAWSAEQQHIHWRTVHVGDTVAVAGQSSPLYIVLTGYARVMREGTKGLQTLGFLCPGDLIGELDPSPVTILAESTLSLLRINRSRLDQLPEEAQSELAERVDTCEAVLAQIS